MRLWQPCAISLEYCHYSIAKIIKNTLYRYNHAELFSFFFALGRRLSSPYCKKRVWKGCVGEFCSAPQLFLSFLSVHGQQELVVVLSSYYPVVYGVHGLDGVHVGNEFSQYPHAVESGLVLQQVITACT